MNNRKKCIILVNSQINLLFAIQLKKTLFCNDHFDLALSSLVKELKNISQKEQLKMYFDNIFFVDYDILPKSIEVRSFINPKIFFEFNTGIEFKEYTDIFFWNPTKFLYFYLFEMKKRNKDVNIHLFGDAMGAYVCDEPVFKGLYKYKLVNHYLRKKYRYKSISEYEYDYYVIGKEYMGFHSKRNVIDVPKVDINDKEFLSYINSVFEYDNNMRANYKYLFMDVHQKERFGESDIGIRFIKSVLEFVPKDDFAIRPHPRQDIGVYSNICDNLIQFKVPWEIYCLNNNISGKVIITFGSSSAFLPYIYTNANYDVICIELENTFNKTFKKEWISFIKIIKNSHNVFLVHSLEELRNIIKELSEKQL